MTDEKNKKLTRKHLGTVVGGSMRPKPRIEEDAPLWRRGCGFQAAGGSIHVINNPKVIRDIETLNEEITQIKSD